MVSWRVAVSLDTLLGEINAVSPNRSKVSDGSIGDAAHASRTSDHNPWVKDSNGVGVVRARDFTHDPDGGLDCSKLATFLASKIGNHPALQSGAYIIWNRRIYSYDRRSEGWRSYSGSNPHDHHLHLSVATSSSGYDSTTPWGWFTKEEEDEMKDQDWNKLEKIVRQIVRDENNRQIEDVDTGQVQNPTDAGVRSMSMARMLWNILKLCQRIAKKIGA